MKVFVYGTLKRGFGNNAYYLAPDEDGVAKSEFLGEDSIDGMVMRSLGGFPGVSRGEGTVHGEVYEVGAEVLRSLDRLEGHPHFYIRVPAKTKNGLEVQVYTLPLDRPNLERYPIVKDGLWTRATANQLRLNQRM